MRDSAPKLKYNDGNYKRFRPSSCDCPDCSKPALEDAWPPNYGGGGGMSNYSWYSGTVKYVCERCRIWFKMLHKNERRNGVTIVDSREIIAKGDLVVMGGNLLTPYDVDQEAYKKEHGKYKTMQYL